MERGSSCVPFCNWNIALVPDPRVLEPSYIIYSLARIGHSLSSTGLWSYSSIVLQTGTRRSWASWGRCSRRHAVVETRRWRGSSPTPTCRCTPTPPPNCMYTRRPTARPLHKSTLNPALSHRFQLYTLSSRSDRPLYHAHMRWVNSAADAGLGRATPHAFPR